MSILESLRKYFDIAAFQLPQPRFPCRECRLCAKLALSHTGRCLTWNSNPWTYLMYPRVCSLALPWVSVVCAKLALFRLGGGVARGPVTLDMWCIPSASGRGRPTHGARPADVDASRHRYQIGKVRWRHWRGWFVRRTIAVLLSR